MTDPTTPDTLTAAAERAREVLPETIANLVFNQLRYSEDPKLIAEVLAMPLRVACPHCGATPAVQGGHDV